jgi:putative transposase
VKFAFIDVESAQWPVAVLCETLDVSRSGYYAWGARPEAPRVAADVAIVAEIKVAHENGRFAYEARASCECCARTGAPSARTEWRA